MSIPTGKISARIQNENGKIKVTKKETKTENITCDNVNRRLPDEELEVLNGLQELQGLDEIQGLDDLVNIENVEDVEIKEDEVVEAIKEVRDKKEWIEFWKYRTKDIWWYLRKYNTLNENGKEVSINEIVDRNLVYNQYVKFLRDKYGKNREEKVSYVSGKLVFIKKQETFTDKKTQKEVTYDNYILSFEPGEVPEFDLKINENKKEKENENEYQHPKENENEENKMVEESDKKYGPYGPFKKTISELVKNVDEYIESNSELKLNIDYGLDIVPEIYFDNNGKYINLDNYLEGLFLNDILTQDLGIKDKGNVIFCSLISIHNYLIEKEKELRMKYKRAYEKDKEKGRDINKYEMEVPIRLISSEIQAELNYDIPNYENDIFIDENYKDIPRTKPLFEKDSRMYWFVIRFGGYFKHLLYTEYFFTERNKLLNNSYIFLKKNAEDFISGIKSGKIKRDGDFYEYFDNFNKKKYKFYANFIESLGEKKNRDYRLKKAYSLEYDPNVILKSDKNGDIDCVNIGPELYYLINPLKREIDNIWKSIINGLKYRKDFVQVFPVLKTYYMNTLKKPISTKIFEGKQFIYNPVYYYLSKQYGNNPIENRFSIRTREEEYKSGQNNSITIIQTVDNTTYYKTITWILLHYNEYISGLKNLFKIIQIEDSKNNYEFEETSSSTLEDIILNQASKKTILVSRVVQINSNSQMSNLPRKDQPIN